MIQFVHFLAGRMARIAPLAALILAGLLGGCVPQREVSEGVQLLTRSEGVGPATTFELRFDQPMVKASQVSVTATNPPLVIFPVLPGTFIWLSQRSGVFTPAEPLRLGTTYELTLRRDLTLANGETSLARLHRTLTTPPFAATAIYPRSFSTNATALPEIRLVFNASVRAAAAAPFCEFHSDDGLRAPAEVRQGTVEERSGWYGGASTRTWRERFLEAQPSPPGSQATEPDAPTNEVPNFVLVTPRQALPVGQGWKLVVQPGVPATEPRLFTRQALEVAVGDVTPFGAGEALSHNELNGGKSITLHFSKPLRAGLTNGFGEWVSVTPEPPGLTSMASGHELTLRGGFQLNTTYTTHLRRGLPAEEPFTLADDAEVKLGFERVPPRLYFPAVANQQLATGQRTLPLLAINVAKFRVRAKLLDPQLAIHGLRGYESYVRPWSERRELNEPYRPVDYNVVPGRTIYSEEFVGCKTPDVPEKIVLDWDRILAGHPAGVVFLSAERVQDSSDPAPRLGTQTVIQLTDLGLLWKQGKGQVTVLVFSNSRGQPVPNATVHLFGNENEPLGEATTDAHGLATLASHTNAVWVAAQLGDDLNALKLDDSSLRVYQAPWRNASEHDVAEDRRVLLFSDRSVYRPGETAHLKAIARDWTDAGLTIPGGLTGQFECADARGRVFFQTNISVSPTGAWDQAVPLPAGPRGEYRCVMQLRHEEFELRFQVQDFQPSAFAISLPVKAVYLAGEAVTIPVSASYYSGSRLAQAHVDWTFEAEDTEFKPRQFDEFHFTWTPPNPGYGRSGATFAITGQGGLSDQTNLVLAPDLPPNPVAPQPRTVSLLVEVTDLDQQTVTRRAEFVRHSSDFYLGLRTTQSVVQAGAKLPLEIAAVRADGQPWPEPVSAQVRLQRIEWQTVRIQGAGHTARYRSEMLVTNVLEKAIQVHPIALPAPSQPGVEVVGDPVADLVPTEAGQYQVEVRAKDSGGRAVVASLSITVSDQAQLAWDYRNDVQLELVADQASYQLGQTAVLALEAPMSGQALVTVERDKVLRSFLTRVEGNAPSIRVPLESGDAPNIYVSVTLLRGAADCPRPIKEPEFRMGTCVLHVTDPQSRLAVNLTSGATNYLPGEAVSWTAAVQDARGQPVSGAEVTLYAVDEGVLSLADYEVPDPHALFYRARPLGVESSISLPNLLSEDPARLTFHNKGYLVGGGGEGGRVRKNFLACAFWNATLHTDERGTVTAQFEAPDSLTRYRVIAVATAGPSQFGHAESAFQVNKPLMLEPALPRFANLTDRLVIRGVVLNQTERAGDVVVTLDLDAKAHAAGTAATSPRLTLTKPVAAKGSTVFEFPVEFVDTGIARWLWRARFADPGADNFADTVQSTLEVGNVAPLLREIHCARVTTTETNLLPRVNPQLLEGTGTVTVTLANTRLAELGEAVVQLLHYPYGCAEQSASSLLPWIVLQDSPALRPFLHQGTNDPDNAIRQGIARLFSMQTASGGLGYWPHSPEPMLWASAYGGLVLALAERHGAAVPEREFGALTTYLSEQLRSTPTNHASLSDCCLASYALALAGRAEPAYHEKFFEQRDQLFAEDRALLALAIQESAGPEAMVEALLQPDATHRSNDWAAFTCPAREAAIQLLARVRHRPDDPGVDTVVNRLMQERIQGHWTTTQGDAWAILALTEYAARVEAELPPAQGTLTWGDESVPFQFSDETCVLQRSFALSPDRAKLPLTLTNQPKSRLFSVIAVEARPPAGPQPRQDQGLRLQRTYARLDAQNQPHDLQGLRVGDRVLVTLRLELARQATFVVIDDPLPAVFEAVNPEFKSQQVSTGAQQAAAVEADGDYWASDWHELRTDRALFFANAVAPGNYTLRYLARVRAAGVATAPSAKAEEMYHPDRYGLSGSQKVESASLP